MNFLETIAAAAIGYFIATLLRTIFEAAVDNRKQKQDDKKSDIAELRAVAFEVRDLAIQYWSTETNGRTVESAALAGRMMYLGQICEERFATNVQIYRDVDLALFRFDNSVTGGEFETNGRMADLGRCAEIETACYSFRHIVQSSGRRV